MRGGSTLTYEYAGIAGLYVHSLSIHPTHRDQSLYDTVRDLSAATRTYTGVVLRLRVQVEKEASMVRARKSRRRPVPRAGLADVNVGHVAFEPRPWDGLAMNDNGCAFGDDVSGWWEWHVPVAVVQAEEGAAVEGVCAVTGRRSAVGQERAGL